MDPGLKTETWHELDVLLRVMQCWSVVVGLDRLTP